MRMLGFILVGLVGLLSAGPASQAVSSEEAAVRAAVDHYLQGHALGSPEEFSNAFHPEAMLFWVTPEGALGKRTSAEYIKGASGKPAADESKRKRQILSVDIAGTAAVAKVELDYPSVHFIDYLSLLKVNGEWKVINKIFHRGAPRS